MIKNRIAELKREGKKNKEIALILNMSESMVYYHSSEKERLAAKQRQIKYKAQNPLLKKLDNFNQTYKKKGLDNKITHFNREGSDGTLSIQKILDKFGDCPKCYLTGDNIDLSLPASYSFDHKIPVSKGGDNSISNLALCTTEANMAKSCKTPEEFIELCKKVLVHNGYDIYCRIAQSGRAAS